MSRPEHVGSNGRGRDAECRRDLVVTESLYLMQHERDPGAAREFGDRGLEIEPFRGIGLARRYAVSIVAIFKDIDPVSAARICPRLVQIDVHGEPMQPRSERALSAKRAEPLPRAHEHILREVESVFPVSGKSQRQRIDPSRLRSIEPLECRGIAFLSQAHIVGLGYFGSGIHHVEGMMPAGGALFNLRTDADAVNAAALARTAMGSHHMAGDTVRSRPNQATRPIPMSQPKLDPLLLSFQLALAGRYSIDRELGRGGMGVVFLAREVHLDRLVAIKLLPPDKARQPGLRARFLQEARLAAKLSHPNVIPIHAVDETGGFVYYVMSYVDGETLAQRVRSRGPLSASDGARMLREVAWALGYAHRQGLVHRDVKPDNILIESASGRALVADFGIAAAAGSTAKDGVSGTPEFMSPEQALGREIDARSDLYGLGATAFFAFSGRLPFEGRSATEVLARQVTEPPPALASVGIVVPRKLAHLVDHCLAKDPAQRPQSADALAEQLSVALEQRRELPAPLRVFVRRTGRIHGGAQLIYLISLVPAAIMVSQQFGSASGFVTLAVGGAVGALAFGVGAARKLTALGFAQSDLAPAFATEMDNSRDERAAEYASGPNVLERLSGTAARTLGTFSMVAFPVTLTAFIMNGATETTRDVLQLVLGMAGSAALIGIGHLALRQLRRDVDTEFWSGLWTGRAGRFFFAIAKRLHSGAPLAPAMTHRATELSLGMAAEHLYGSLPKATRGALSELPALLQRLQRDAQLLRERYDRLQEALGEAGVAAAGAEYESARATRDAIGLKLGDVVGALETIRLNLLRLHAGSATIEGLTTHLGIAVDLSDEIDRLIAAKGEVEDHLRFPSEAEPTPV